MKTFTLPGTDLVVPNLIQGCMRIEEMSDDAVRDLVRGALAEGITFFDHADCYGSVPHACEARFADALDLTPSMREGMILQTKCGIRSGYLDFSAEHILATVEASLRALRTEWIDVLLLHRPDALVEPEEVARAFAELYAAGKVRNFGVSNHTPGQIELLRRYVDRPLVVDQVQLSITHSPLVATGLAANMAGTDQAIDRDNGLLDYCRLHDITIQAWSPFQKGFFDGVFLGDRQAYGPLNDVLDRLAAAYGVTPLAVATAWITRHPARMQVVLGTTTLSRVREAAAGSELPLTRAEWYELFTAAGHIVP